MTAFDERAAGKLAFDERVAGKRAFDERAAGKRPFAEVIGDPIAQSKSPLIHNFWLRKLGIDAEYRATLVAIDEVPAYFAERRTDPDWRGCNVTMPLKQTIAPLVDQVDEFAARAGAINIVFPEGTGLRGQNSDGAGFLEPLGQFGANPGRACVIGTGGAARAIAVALTDAGFELDILGRSAARAGEFADAIGVKAASYAISDPPFEREGAFGLKLLVNATSLGMNGQPPLPLSLAALPVDVAVYEIVTWPLETPLLIEARGRGMRSFDGLQMLVGQAAVAFERFFGQPPPRAHDAELREKLLA